MKLFLKQMVAAGVILLLSATSLYATANNHWSLGSPTIKGATLPPPGFYYRMYNSYYTADEIKDGNGDEVPAGFDISVFSIANRFIWVTDKQFLGGDIFMNAAIAIVSIDVEIGAFGVDQDNTGLGDLYIEPFGLSWHGPGYDASLGFSAFLPTAEYDENDAASLGKGFYSFLVSAGWTHYFDAQRTWSASIVGKYEIHTEKEDSDLTPGDDLHIEWGIGKSFAKVWTAGLAGYCHWQVTDDSGADTIYKSTHDQVYAIGPEISVFLPQFKVDLNLSMRQEFGAEDRSEGRVFVFTFSKIF